MPRILVVEDSPTQALAIQLILEAEGFEVATAGDGATALDLLRAQPFDLVVSDVLMPGLSGYELCQRVKADPVLRRVPVLLLTSLNDPADILQGLQCGADHFVTKPYQPAHLLDRIRDILARRSPDTGAKLPAEVEVCFLGKKVNLTAAKQPILDLLLTSYEDTVRTHRELQSSQAELAAAKARIEAYARQQEDRARTSEEKYRSLMEQADDAIFLLDPHGAVLEINRRAAESLGRPATALVGQPFAELLPAAEQDGVARMLQQLRTAGAARLDNVHLRRTDGQLVDMEVSASLVDVGGRHVVLVIARDVTVRNRLEGQLRQAQKLEAVGRLADGVAHDFKNLLTVIGVCSGLLLRRLPHDPTAIELIEDIKTAGEQGATLTRQLLAFSRPQAVAPRVLDLNAVVADVAKLLQRLLGENVTLDWVLEPGPVPVRADPGQLEQILMNLAVNARDAMPEGGRLTIETASVVLDEREASMRPGTQPGRYVRLTVRDTGHGMDEATRARIFEPFFTTKGPGQGTGLGLATVYGIVQQSGGHIGVASAPGRGTTFQVYLPQVPL
jgi:PAS domain S-box-containing protein